MKIYQAGPLFSEPERNWHQGFKKKLADAGHEVMWPGEFFSEEEIKAWGADAPKHIMERDRAAIDACNVMVALLDGTHPSANCHVQTQKRKIMICGGSV